MEPEKIGKLIKEIRKKNNLTQEELAKKYGVTYQAVSKWENGKNIPDISILKQISKDYNISLDDFLEGSNKIKKINKHHILLAVIIILLTVIVLLIVIKKPFNNNFDFKTISTTCEEFKVSGSVAYDKEKSSIYISDINYCGGDDTKTYQKIECTLYENNSNLSKKISSCESTDKNIKLEDYLKDVKLNIDNYNQMCKTYSDNSLYLEINATDNNNVITTYKIPLMLNKNCSK